MAGEGGHWPQLVVARTWAAAGISIWMRWTVDRAHEVSILIAATPAVGRYRGEQPRAKVSMMIMRPPQQGQGCSGVGGALALVWPAVAASLPGFGMAISLRARAMFSARVVLANRP
jgi:hypothetical protein